MAMQCGSQRRRAVYVHQWACVARQIKRCLDVCQSRHGDVCVPWACDARRIEKAFVRPEKSGVCVPWCISPASVCRSARGSGEWESPVARYPIACQGGEHMEQPCVAGLTACMEKMVAVVAAMATTRRKMIATALVSQPGARALP
jgi:hypothetical protein